MASLFFNPESTSINFSILSIWGKKIALSSWFLISYFKKIPALSLGKIRIQSLSKWCWFFIEVTTLDRKDFMYMIIKKPPRVLWGGFLYYVRCSLFCLVNFNPAVLTSSCIEHVITDWYTFPKAYCSQSAFSNISIFY